MYKFNTTDIVHFIILNNKKIYNRNEVSKKGWEQLIYNRNSTCRSYVCIYNGQRWI